MENYDAMIILLKYNCDCNICKKNGNSPLHIATKKGKMNFISALLRHGANPNLINKLYNQTPFHIAIIEKLSKDIIALFKNFNADLYNIKDKYDKTPFDYCKENGEDYENMVKNIFCESYQDFQNNLKEKQIRI
jgi:ankyrin repeat protein